MAEVATPTLKDIKELRKALERIADEEKVYRGHGDYDILPALSAKEAQQVARSALASKPLPPTDDVRVLEVTQEDREAAADYMEKADWSYCSVLDTRNGLADQPSSRHLNEGQLVQAFAHHRLAALSAQSPPPADDDVDRVAKALSAVLHDPEGAMPVTEYGRELARAAIAAMPAQSPPPIMGEGLVKRVSAVEAFEMGYAWNAMLWGQTLEDSRAVGRTLYSDTFEAIREEIDAEVKRVGFSSFEDADHGVCAAKEIIHAVLALATPSLPEGMVMVPREHPVFKFLLGEGELEGCWYGDPFIGRKPYWWREHLREALATSPAPALRIKGEDGK